MFAQLKMNRYMVCTNFGENLTKNQAKVLATACITYSHAAVRKTMVLCVLIILKISLYTSKIFKLELTIGANITINLSTCMAFMVHLLVSRLWYMCRATLPVLISIPC